MSRKRGNGEGSITRHKASGRWMARYTVETPDGAKRRTLYGKTRREAADKLSEALADRSGGIVVDDKNMSVAQYLDAWLAGCVRGTIRGSTFSRDAYLVANHAKPTVGRVKLKNLNALHLQGLYRERLDSGLSGSTVQKIHHVLHKALAQAVMWDLIPRNPADAVKAPTPSGQIVLQLEPLGLLCAGTDYRQRFVAQASQASGLGGGLRGSTKL